MRADLLIGADAGDGVGRAREEIFFEEIEDGDGGVEFAAEERALEAGLVLLALLEGEVGAGGDERDELGDGLGGAADGGVGVDFLGENPDCAEAAGGGAVALLESGERRGRRGGVVGKGVALERDVVVAQADDGAEIRRDVEDILEVKSVGFDADAGGFLEAGGGAVTDIRIQERDGGDGGDLVAGGATANLVVVLEDGADHEAVGVAGDRFFQREIEAVADEDVVAVDEREGAARDVFGDGIPRVALGVLPLEELAGDVGLVAEFKIGREAEIGAHAVEDVLGRRVVVEDVVVRATGGGLDAGVDHAVGGVGEEADLGLGVGDGGVDDGIVDDGVAVVTLVPIVEEGAEPREREFIGGAPREGEGDGVVALGVSLLIGVGLVVRVIGAVADAGLAERAADAEADAVAAPGAIAREGVSSEIFGRGFRNIVYGAADGAFAEHESVGAFEDFDAIEEKGVDGARGLGGGVLADAVAQDGDVVAAEAARGVGGDGAEVGAACHADGGFDCFDGGAEAAELHHFLGDDGNARGEFSAGESEARTRGGEGVEREGKVIFLFGGDGEAVEGDEVAGGGFGRLGGERRGREGEQEDRGDAERERR